MKKLLGEFREFAIKGNMLDLAIGVVIGAAFGKIVSSLVADIIMPPLGLLLGGMDFSKMSITLAKAVGETPAVTLNYGMFIQAILDFLIIALCLFFVVKGVNKMRKKHEQKAPDSPPPPSKEELLLTDIRDLLKEQSKQPKK
ncbi:MAG TPA: large-conductance mechanosensitive channel protein MscL [Oscillospiraceae bacterium]|nr:large-conductance mechanosensitive channel protein MscL [Oscillospiraceae bacterium]